MRYLISMLAAAVLAASPTAAKEPSKEAAAANVEAMETGKQLYLHDQAAWHGTDALAAKVDLAAEPELRGYLVDPLPNGNLGLVFFAEDDEGHYEFARYEVAKSRVVRGELRGKDSRIALSPRLERMVAARTAAVEEFEKRDWNLCTRNAANFVGLPPDENGVIRTYFLTATTEANSHPFGGHYRIDVGPDGKVVSSRKFTNSCLNMGFGKNEEGQTPYALAVSHILDDQPTEIHYFQSYYVPAKVFVIIEDDAWVIEKGKFKEIEEM